MKRPARRLGGDSWLGANSCWLSQHESAVTVTPQLAGHLRTLDGVPADTVELAPFGAAVRAIVS